ncbi:MAG: stage III sporulation protein AG [Clostridiales bacterium]|nr:stage III sporulation protein AG [Clostridiales bacterium]
MRPKWDAEKAKELLKRYQYVLLVLALGVGLMLWPSGEDTGDTAETETSVQTADTSLDDTVADLEQRMAQALSRMQGVGETTVVLTVKSGTQLVLATDEDGDERETVIVSAGSSQQETVTVQEIAPQLQGALVVCAGGGDPEVRLRVLQAVEALTGLNANQISICEGTGGNEK